MAGRTTAVRLAALVIGALALGAPAQALAQDEQPKPKFFFTCDGDVKLQNAALAATGEYSWSDKPPTGSFTAGEGCGYVDPPLSGTGPETVYDGVFGGEFNGAFIAAKVELHNLVLGRAAWSAFIPRVIARLTVDGEEKARKTFDVTPVVSSTGVSQAVTFQFTGLNIPKTTSGRRITLTVDSIGAAWVYDAAEVPASIEFTPPPVTK